ncbi:MAG: mannose-1-phosphate guanylyltransferase [Candidatus Binataceae bacterium]
MAGGRGTRFWPESRSGRPKPLFSIDGKSSLLADTIARTQPLIPRELVFVLVSADQTAPFRRALGRLIPNANLIIEPEGRGTAVAIAYGTGIISRRLGQRFVVAVMPADHYMRPAAGFRRTLIKAIALARRAQRLVVIGVTPTRPESGYGYQEIGAVAGSGFKVERFVEKPSSKLAARMVKSGRFLWNAGIFVMRADSLAAALRAHAPVLADAMTGLPRLRGATLARAYRKLRFDSFDRVVVEKSADVMGVKASFDWHDVGSWEGLWEALRGRSPNVLHGNVVTLDSERVLARGGKRLLVLLGVNDLVAVDTDDAILIAHRSHSQDVRKVIEQLRHAGLARYL